MNQASKEIHVDNISAVDRHTDSFQPLVKYLLEYKYYYKKMKLLTAEPVVNQFEDYSAYRKTFEVKYFHCDLLKQNSLL